MGIKKYIILFCLLLPQIITSHSTYFFSRLQKLYCQNITKQNASLGLCCSKAFVSLDHLISQKKSISTINKNPDIYHIFKLISHRSLYNISSSDMQDIQILLLTQLYKQLFKENIKKTESLLHEITISLEYWKTALFYEKLSMSRKSVTYWLHKASYKKKVLHYIKILTELEQQTAMLLGISMHGYNTIMHIAQTQDIATELIKSIAPIYQFFNAALPEVDDLNAEQLFQELCGFSHSIKNIFIKCYDSIDEHKKPHHVLEHKLFYSTLACVCISSYIAYCKYKDHIPHYKKKVNEACDNYIQEYIVDSLRNLKEVLWENKVEELPKLKRSTLFHHLHLEKLTNSSPVNTLHPITYQPIHLQLQPDSTGKISWLISEKQINENLIVVEKDLNSTISSAIGDINKNITSLVDDLNQTFSLAIDDLNKNIESINQDTNQNLDNIDKFIDEKIEKFNIYIDTINKYAKNQQVNLYLAAIGPSIFIGYTVYRFGKNLYDRYIRHDTWYKPMRLLLRSIDRTLNNITTQQERSFADDGKLYFAILRLKTFVYCLSNEELMLFKEDIAELLSFELNYSQKQKIIARMYKTYEFLK